MAQTEIKSKLKLQTSSLRAYTMLAALVIIWIFFHWQTGSIFLTPRNLSNLMLQTSVTGIIAVGMLMVIISGNIDLSVGSLLALAGGAAAIILTKLGYGLVPSVLAAIAVGVLVGLFQGFLTSYGRIPAFIVTLGGLLCWRGAIKGISQSETIPIFDDSFKAIGQQYIDPTIGWVLAAIAIVAVLIMSVRQVQQEKVYQLQENKGEKAFPLHSIGLVLSLVGIFSFLLPWTSFALLTNQVANFTGYALATGIVVLGSVSVGGQTILMLFPALMIIAFISSLLILFQEKLRVLVAPTLAITGFISSILLFYFFTSPQGIGSAYSYGVYLGLFSSVYMFGIGLYGMVLDRYLKEERSDIPVSKLFQMFIPIGGTLTFILVMNSYAGIPIPVLIFLAIALFGFFVTNNTTFGRYIYAIGGNADAARLSGINNRRVVLKVFALLGAFTGIAAVIYTARVASGTPDAGTLLELDAIAACVIGGTSLMGGRGTVFGACLGALIMASLDNGMSLLNYADYTQELIKGSILVAAVGLDMVGRKS